MVFILGVQLPDKQIARVRYNINQTNRCTVDEKHSLPYVRFMASDMQQPDESAHDCKSTTVHE